MSYEELKAFCDLLMVSDPWPLDSESNELMTDLADRVAQEHGFNDWIEAFHA